MAQDRRIATLQQHLNSSGAVTANTACDVERHITAALAEGPTYFDTRALHKWLEHDNHDLRREIFEFLKDDLYKPAPYLNLMEFRELTLRRLQRFAQQKFFSIRDYVQDPRKFMAALECLAFCDYSLAIKAGVHYTLCGGTVLKLGTSRHHQQFLPGIDDLSLPGCFGMTELGHGSNVMGIETTAEYQADTQTFLINTPRDEASKYWIGGAAQHGKLCTVFAQLTVRGQYQGVHVFAVRIRDDRGTVVPGVRIEDNGAKMGLNGVDNGRIWFKNASVPRDALLDRYASVDPDGQYRSPVPTVAHRFGTMIGGLTTGRILIAQAAVDACKIGLTIAVRYSCQRTQFGDKPIMSYLTHQRRLLPGLAGTFALHLGMAHLKRISAAAVPDAKLTHVLSSGLKAAATWTRVEVLQNCRECCGGMGFLAANKIGVLKTDMDVDTTFEGDNTVLMQQVVKALLEAARRKPETLASRTAATWAAGGEPRLPELQDLLAVREHSLMQQLATAVASRQGDAEAALEAEMDVVVQLGWAHVEAMLLQQFAAALASAPRDASRALEKLCYLFALTRVERGAAFFLAEKLLTPQDMERARRSVNRICAELTENDGAMALQLCDAWCIPPHLLQAPIAFDWRNI